MHQLGIRREILSYERRAPISPRHIPIFSERGIDISVQPSENRIFDDQEYVEGGARLADELSAAKVILGLKEVPADRLYEDKVHAFFSHTIKGQPKNMPMLLHLMERGCTLIDYEKIVDDDGKRIVFFGHYAGVAGMVDTLWALGQRLAKEGVETPLFRLKAAIDYESIEIAQKEVEAVGKALLVTPLPEHLTPLIIGVAGDGNAARGAKLVLDSLGAKTLTPADLGQLPVGGKRAAGLRPGPGVYQVVFRERDMVEPRLGIFDPTNFDVGDYYERPGRYRGVFERYLPYLNVLVNCIYWDERYPRLVTVEGLRQLFDFDAPRLKVIGDISCDIRGAIEATVRATTPSNPVYVYDVETGSAVDGVEGHGPVILAIYNLPSEFPREASVAFSEALMPFVQPLAEADYETTFDKSGLTEPLKRATIVYRGALTPSYRYLEQYL